MVTILYLIYLCFRHNLAAIGCSIGFSPISTPSDPRLLSGYNNYWPNTNLTFYDKAVILSAQKLYPGAFRYPGGTVANYWNIQDANYVQPCNTSHYNYCTQQQMVSKLPKQTFSPYHFTQGVASTAPLSEMNAHSIVYDLNLLTLSGNALLSQLDTLENEIGVANVQYLELGDEYYIQNQYSWEFPNVSAYINKALPLISQARLQFSNSKIAGVGEATLVGDDSPWNNGLTKYKQYIDSVTFHDYSLTEKMIENLTQSQQKSFISIYGLSVIPQYVEYVLDEFGSGKSLWMTEYNMAILNSSVSFSVLHAMYGLSYIIASVCNSKNVMEFLMFNEYSIQGSDSGYDSVSFDPLEANDNSEVMFSVVGQIFAQLSYISMVSNDKMHCLGVTNGMNETCPTLKLSVVGTRNLKCVNGIGFTCTANNIRFGFVLSNSCDQLIDIELNMATIVSNINLNIQLDVWRYAYWQTGGNSGYFAKCKNNEIWDDSCAAVKANLTRMTVGVGTKLLNMTIDPLSVIIANVPFM